MHLQKIYFSSLMQPFQERRIHPIKQTHLSKLASPSRVLFRIDEFPNLPTKSSRILTSSTCVAPGIGAATATRRLRQGRHGVGEASVEG
eukprot:2746750-Pleurochrysis_carterae.AAC.2